MLEGLNHFRYVYHYTSIETLFAILERYRKDKIKESLVFRATNIYRLNDHKEMEAGYDLVKSFLCEYEKEGIPEVYWLYEISNNKENERKCKEDYIVGNVDYLVGPGIVPYTISFSARRDYLPMWSLYGKTGKGVCLKFDVYDIIDNQEEGMIGFVTYNTKSGMRYMKDVIPQMYDWYMNEYKNKTDELTIENKLKELATICLSISPYVKYKDYQYEKEFRLTYNKDYGIRDFNSKPFRLAFRQPISNIPAYHEILISANSLKEIIMGPSMDNNMKDIIKRETSLCKLDVRISKSRIPFRI